MAKKKSSTEEFAGRKRHAFGHDIDTIYRGESGWAVQIAHGGVLRKTLEGFRHEGEAYWAGEDWAHMHAERDLDSLVRSSCSARENRPPCSSSRTICHPSSRTCLRSRGHPGSATPGSTCQPDRWRILGPSRRSGRSAS